MPTDDELRMWYKKNTKQDYKHREAVVVEAVSFCRVRVDLNDTVMVYQHFDDHGNHRLVCGEVTSEWKTYRGISSLQVPGLGQFKGSTEYYSGELPRVFQVIDHLDV